MQLMSCMQVSYFILNAREPQLYNRQNWDTVPEFIVQLFHNLCMLVRDISAIIHMDLFIRCYQEGFIVTRLLWEALRYGEKLQKRTPKEAANPINFILC